MVIPHDSSRGHAHSITLRIRATVQSIMQSKANGVLPGQSQIVGQSAAAAIQPITRSIQSGITAGVGVGLGVGEIIIRVICTVFCIGILIPSAVAISAINSVEESLEQRGNASSEYENADGYRSITIYLVCISSLAMVFHILMIIVRILYLTSVLKKLFRIYVILNGIVCVLFALSLLSGGIVSIIYASENGGLWRDLCLLSGINFEFDDCSSLQSVVATEAVSGALSFLAMILFGVLCLILICTYCMVKSKEQSIKQPNTYIKQPQVTQSHVSPQPTRSTTVLSYPPTETLTPTAPSSSLLRETASHYLPPSSPDQSPTNTLSPSAPSSSLLRGTISQLSSFSQQHSRTNSLQDLPPYPLPRLSTNVSSYAAPSAPPSQTINVSLHGSAAQGPPYESTVTSEYNPQ